MPGAGHVSIGVRPEAHRRLSAFAGRLQAETGRRITMTDAVITAVDRAENANRGFLAAVTWENDADKAAD